MALEDINMERVPESAMLKLPPVSKGDLVLVLAQGSEWGDCLLFCSDGRVAQTDIVVADPYKIQREAQRHFGEQTELELGKISRLFVDEAVKKGFLREYVAAFGRDDGRYKGEPTVGIEFEILYQSPRVLFGVDLSYAVGSVVRAGDFTSRANFFSALNPYEHGYLSGERNKIISYPTRSVKGLPQNKMIKFI